MPRGFHIFMRREVSISARGWRRADHLNYADCYAVPARPPE